MQKKKQTGKWGIHPKNPDAWPEELKGMHNASTIACFMAMISMALSTSLCNVLGFQLGEEVVDGELRGAVYHCS